MDTEKVIRCLKNLIGEDFLMVPQTQVPLQEEVVTLTEVEDCFIKLTYDDGQTIVRTTDSFVCGLITGSIQKA